MVVNVTASPFGDSVFFSFFFSSSSNDTQQTAAAIVLPPKCADKAWIQTVEESQGRSDESSCF